MCQTSICHCTQNEAVEIQEELESAAQSFAERLAECPRDTIDADIAYHQQLANLAQSESERNEYLNIVDTLNQK